MAEQSVRQLSTDLVKKAKAGTLTIGEAIDFVSNPRVPMPESYKSVDKQGIHVARNQMKTVRNNMETLRKLAPEDFPLGLDTPLKDMRNAEIIFLFRRDGSPDLSNRAYTYQIFENILHHNLDKYGFGAIMEDVGDGIQEAMYPRLAGAGNPMGTQRTGLAGERPMQGLLEKAKLDTVYEEALPEIEAKYGPRVRRLVEYHRNTFQRPEQLVNLTTDDIVVDGDTITVKGKKTTKTDHKGRPELKFKVDSPTGRLLTQAVNDPDVAAGKSLFGVDADTFSDAFNDHVGKRLSQFKDVLPLADVKVTLPDGKVEIQQRAVTTPSAIRSIVPHYLRKELKVHKDVVQSLMGHIDADTLERNYVGITANTDLPFVIENPANFGETSFGTGTNAQFFDRSLLSEEQIELIAGELTEAETQEAKARSAVAVRVQAVEALTTQDAVIERAQRADEEREADKINAETDAQKNVIKAEADSAAKRGAAVNKGANAKNAMYNEFARPKKPTLRNVALATLGAGLTALGTFPPTRAFAKTVELGLETAGVLGDVQEGASTREQMMKLGVDSRLATAAGVTKTAANILNPASVLPPQPAVADPLSPRPIDRAAVDIPEIAASGNMQPVNIPDPVPAQTGALEAEGFAEKRNVARSAAMEGKRTEMVNSFFTMNQP